MESFVGGAKRRIAHAWAGHLQRVANKHADEIRELQTESGRDKKLLIRFDVFECDVKRRGLIQQQVYTFFFRIVEGRVQMCAESAQWDGHVLTDIPVLVGLQDGYMDKRLPGNSGVERIEPFTPRRAWLMGRILTEGDATMLSNLLLFEKRVWEEMLREVRSPPGPN